MRLKPAEMGNSTAAENRELRIWMMKIVTVFPHATRGPFGTRRRSVAVKVEAADGRADRVAVEKDGHEEPVVAGRKPRQRHREASVVFPARAAGRDHPAVLADEDVPGHRPDRQCLAQRVALEGDANEAVVALLLERDLSLRRRQHALAVPLDARD